ncbi:hypothetical protein JN00_0353 [Metamycoplasma subdolum]|uniref:Uncharacterized protein n=1 Tax=Metamycoplasma subdolum TaxID=92407 RepID=A0A3M0A0I9_9BACT|nr:hypothetical protein [Metamycoplasma subdolum]RMA78523.1 hypothetical protein JN00_0353 [Metamycoplasma subdolum]WPB50455.1 hypothetical protein R9C05_02510 [Metamycoplasma subdolum]
MKLAEIKQIIEQILMTIPGIVALKTRNETGEDLDGQACVTFFENNNNIVDIKLGLILLSNASAKSIVETAHKTITFQLKKLNISLGNLSVTIRGTK